MLVEVIPAHKAPRTHVTGEPLLAGVRSPVALQLIAARESFRALGALVGPVSGVRENVRSQVAGLRVRFAATLKAANVCASAPRIQSDRIAGRLAFAVLATASADRRE